MVRVDGVLVVTVVHWAKTRTILPAISPRQRLLMAGPPRETTGTLRRRRATAVKPVNTGLRYKKTDVSIDLQSLGHWGL